MLPASGRYEELQRGTALASKRTAVPRPQPVHPRTNRSSMCTVSPSARDDEPNQPSSRSAPTWLDTVIDLIKWILRDHRRSWRALLFMSALLLAAVSLAWVLGPSVGGIVGSGVAGGGVGVGAARSSHRRRAERT